MTTDPTAPTDVAADPDGPDLLDDVLDTLARHGEHPPRDVAAAWLEQLFHDA